MRLARLALLGATILGALGCFAGSASASVVPIVGVRPVPTEAVLEPYVVGSAWTTAEGWPPQTCGCGAEPLTVPEAMFWGSGQGGQPGLVERGEAYPAVGHLSLGELAVLEGVDVDHLLDVWVRNKKGEERELSAAEALSQNDSAPYIFGEGASASESSIALVRPQGGGLGIDSGVIGTLEVVFQIEGGIGALAPLEVAPAEPTAGESVEFAPPVLENEFPGEELMSSCHWSFGDGTTSDECHPHHVYAPSLDGSVTVYEVEVTVTFTSRAFAGFAAASRLTKLSVRTAPAPTAPPPPPPPIEPPESPPPGEAPAGGAAAEALSPVIAPVSPLAPGAAGTTPPTHPTHARKPAAAGKPEISAKTRAGLLRAARRFAARDHDPDPQRVTAVRTTQGAALRHVHLKGRGPGRAPVYVIAMRGAFRVGRSARRGSAPVIHTVVLEVSANSFAVLSSRLGGSSPDLEALGTPVGLGH